MDATLGLPHLRLSRNGQFTCIACRIVFPTSERQRNHCRTDWHKYNLKRKIADLDPVDAEQFAQKVLAQQARNREEQERQGFIYECHVCRKSYTSENGYHNHIRSKKHRELEIKKEIITQHQPARLHHVGPLFSDVSDLSEQSDLEDGAMAAARLDPHALCIFCVFRSKNFECNLEHMSRVHGFFLPDQEYLVDQRGLILYLAGKIEQENLCLYCNGRGKEYKSAHAVRAHMIEKGHCKMAYDDSEDPVKLLEYYDFEPLQEIEEPVVSSVQELVLNSGVRLGHRKDMKIFKQRLRKNTNVRKYRMCLLYE
ncbi:C2H2 type zinc-finger-domain-containing protein [Dichotomocladium elegans]|nr:C2H2 type zinc-finger-domain-containing protein [Dichotomocladium elegans]